MKLDAAPWSARKLGKRALKHALWVFIALGTGGAWVLYFADAPTLLHQLVTGRAAPVSYLWIGIFTFVTYYLAGHMREQVCLYMCPWPRIQAALIDSDALNLTYRADRGEPKLSVKEAAKAKAAGLPAGDCVDCHQCVAACPTGVDIRHGSQLGCIQCGLCIDACDTVMTKIGRPTRLIAYDTDENIRRRAKGEPPVYRLIRPRTILYAAAIALVGSVMLYTLAFRTHTSLSVLHVRAPMYTLLQKGVRNGYTLRFANKMGETRKFALVVTGIEGAVAKSEEADVDAQGRLIVSVDPDATQEVQLYVTVPKSPLLGSSQPIVITSTDLGDGQATTVTDHFFGP